VDRVPDTPEPGHEQGCLCRGLPDDTRVGGRVRVQDPAEAETEEQAGREQQADRRAALVANETEPEDAQKADDEAGDRGAAADVTT
jgi:hypothetical protein